MNGFIWIMIGVIAAVIAKRKIRNAHWIGLLFFAVIGAFVGGSVYGLLIAGGLIHGSGMLPIGSVFTAVIGTVLAIVGYSREKH
ncbi:hypothetical protein ACQ4M3_13470 [Leptolyngbya sp. AN03gr2]|uniref:hypothetical protein n=1 Tax=unclassified Leptolyngbya TaxID=2650499 RepID=UPI003D3236CF